MAEVNEAVETTKKQDNGKWIKLGAIVLALILIFNLFGGDKFAKKAEKVLVNDYKQEMEEYDAKSIKVKAKLVGKNKEAMVYCFDLKASCKLNGEKIEHYTFVFMYSDGESCYALDEIEYNKERKKDSKEVAMLRLSRY